MHLERRHLLRASCVRLVRALEARVKAVAYDAHEEMTVNLLPRRPPEVPSVGINAHRSAWFSGWEKLYRSLASSASSMIIERCVRTCGCILGAVARSRRVADPPKSLWTAATAMLSLALAGCSELTGTGNEPSHHRRSDGTTAGQSTAASQGFPADFDLFALRNFQDLAVSAYGPEVPVTWMHLVYRLVGEGRMSPPVASRVYAYVGITLYEAMVPGMRDHQSLAGQLHGLRALPASGRSPCHWPTVANEALATILSDLFRDSPSALEAIQSLRDGYADSFLQEIPRGVFLHSRARGKVVATAIARWASRDGFSEYHNCAASLPDGPGSWVPTPPAFAPPIEPCWGELRTFAVPSADVTDPGPPLPYSDTPGSDFYNEVREVYDAVNGLTEEQRAIVRFWADGAGTGTPAGHAIMIASQCVTDNGQDLGEASECFARVGIAVADAFIACWATKYRYCLVRPVTYIRQVIDSGWTTPIATPPFPEYTSGHSVQSGAAAQVLTDVFGPVPFTDHTHDDLGLPPRSFSNFFEAAHEAAISRVYGGIHYRESVERGLDQGRAIGEYVNGLRFLDGAARGSHLAPEPQS